MVRILLLLVKYFLEINGYKSKIYRKKDIKPYYRLAILGGINKTKEFINLIKSIKYYGNNSKEGASNHSSNSIVTSASGLLT